MTLLVDYTKGWEYIDSIKGELITNPVANMTHFPLCCSTGIIKNVAGHAVTKTSRPGIDAPAPFAKSLAKEVKAADYIHHAVRAANNHGMRLLYPYEVGAWMCMSLMYVKAVEGADDGGSPGYSKFKAAQILMCDRINEDKRNKEFKFSCYNTTWSVDQLMDFLDGTDGKYGEVLVSDPQPGGHGAKVRACIFTPDHDAMKEYHDKRLKQIKSHILGVIDWAKGSKVKDAVNSVTKHW